MSSSVSATKKFKCDHPGCTKSFNRRDYLLRHAANHLEVLPYQCPQCPLRFARADLLEKHMKTKSHERRRLREQRQQEAEQKKAARRRTMEKSDHQQPPRSHQPQQHPLNTHQISQSQSLPEQTNTNHANPANPPNPPNPSNPPNSDYYYTNQYEGWGYARVPPYYDYSSQSSSGPAPPPGPPPGPGGPSGPSGPAPAGAPGAHVAPQYQVDAQVEPMGENSLFFNLPERMPQEFGNLDAGNVPASVHLDNHVSGNYAWLFGHEFMTNQSAASFAYGVLTDSSATANAAAAVMASSAGTGTVSGSGSGSGTASSEGPSTSSAYTTTNATSSLPESSQSYDQNGSGFQSYDYLGLRVETSSELLSEYSKLTNASGSASAEPLKTSVTDAPSPPLVFQLSAAETPLQVASTRPVFQREPKTQLNVPKQHVFGRTYGPALPSAASSLQADYVSIDASARDHILNELGRFGAVKSNPAYFTQQALSSYMEYYWINFDPLYPFIHRATFKASMAPPKLLISMVIVGMGYSDDSATYGIAVDIHKKVRLALLSEIDDQPNLPVWILQGLLLIDYFALNFAPWQMNEMSQIFHGSHIALLHRSGYLTEMTIPEIPSDYSTIDYEAFWKYYIEYETKKRTAFFTFVTDTQQAVFYSHSLGLSSFEVNLELPCSDACWEATTASSFVEIYKNQPRHLQPRPQPDVDELVSQDHIYQEISNTEKGESEPVIREISIKTQGNWPTLLFSIRRLMLPHHVAEKEYPLECFSPYTRCILLHGLLNLEWEMQRRGILDIGIVSKRRMREFKTRMVLAIASWKAHYDRQLKTLNTPELNRIVTATASSSGSSPMVEGNAELTNVPSGEGGGLELNNYSNTFMICSNWALYHYALIILYGDTKLLRAYAERDGSTSDLQYQQALEYTSQWIRRLDARWAVWHSMHFLEKILSSNLLIFQGDVLPWCTYIAIVTFWAYDRSKQDKYGWDLISGREYYSIDDNGSVYIDEEKVRRDAMQYLDLVKSRPPKALDDDGADGDEANLESKDEDSNDDETAEDKERARLLMSVICQGYFMLQNFDRSKTLYIPNLRRLLERYRY
uniref:ARAD1C10472p n=1 Tax=Blastobotrys adeninivorans TaxID=409370 RepID=A0A060T5A4_BLAAD